MFIRWLLPSYDKIDNVMAPLLNLNNTVSIRKEILENKDTYKDYIECLNAPVIKNQDYKLRKYYDIDIVEKFNSFQMFICGEELGDLPGISLLKA